MNKPNASEVSVEERVAIALHLAYNHELDTDWPGWQGATDEERGFFLGHARAALASAAPKDGGGDHPFDWKRLAAMVADALIAEGWGAGRPYLPPEAFREDVEAAVQNGLNGIGVEAATPPAGGVGELPELPKPWQCETAMCPPLYSAEQMREYGEKCRAPEPHGRDE